MLIRVATVEDGESIRAVHDASIRGLGPSAYSDRVVAAWAAGTESADYTASITDEDVVFVVAEHEDDVVGFGSLSLEAPEEYEAPVEAEVTGVYVDPGVARQGVGTRLYETLESRARNHDVEVVALMASLNAVGFYEAHGYERVRTTTHEFSAHEATGVTGEVVEMMKRL